MRGLAGASLILGLGFALCPVPVDAQGGRKGKPGPADQPVRYLSEVPAYRGNVILGRPTARSVTANVMMNTDTKVRIRFGFSGRLERQSEIVELKAGQPREIILDNLQPDSAFEYRVVDADFGLPLLPESGNGTFHTQRGHGSAFTFTVQADSHLDGNSVADLYRLTLRNVLQARPDFHIDLGDTFMTGKIVDRTSAAKQYLSQRYYLGLVGWAAPLFLTVGNHDGEEAGRGRGGEADGLVAWSCLQRKLYFSNPEPDTFYAGNLTDQPQVGRLQDYYAWEWGDAVFVVLDPYWYSSGNRGGREPWNMTLGKTQYDWLGRTLRDSKAKFKFVFIHQLVGGLDQAGRGGSEAAPLFEWGGHELDGRDTFAANRAGWEKPIHRLLAETGVTIVFHGHDHFFARQELDSVVYQLVPQPAHRNFRHDQAAEYGYRKGDFLPNSGHLRVQVSPEQVAVDYIRTAGSDMVTQGLKNGGSAFSYTQNAR